MQIHELNNYTGNLDASAYLAVDNGMDTGKVSVPQLLSDVNQALTEAENTLNGRIDNIIAGGAAPSEAEIIDARHGANGVNYPSLGDAIRGQITILDDDVDYLHGVILDFESLEFTPSTYIKNDTAIGETVDTTQISSGTYESIKYECIKGQRFLITVDGGSSARAYSFVDTSNKQLLVAADTTNYTNELLVAPADGYLLVNNKNTQPSPSVKAEYFKVKEEVEALEIYTEEILIVENIIAEETYTTGSYYSTGWGNIASNAALGIFPELILKPNTTYCIKAPSLDFTWLKNGANVGVLIKTLTSFVDNGDGTYTFTTWDTTNTIKLFITVADANKNIAYFVESDSIPSDANREGFVYIPNLSLAEGRGKTLFVSKSYDSSVSGWGVTKFASVIDAVNSITDSSESNPYTIIVEAGAAGTPIVYDDWNTVFGGHAPAGDTYVGVQLPSYVTITTTAPTHPERTIFYFDGHAGIDDTMTYNDAYKKCLFHINGKKMGVVVEGVTLRSKDCRYAFHPESGVDGYQVSWALKNCIIDWQGSPHASETGWSGTVAIGVGLGYGGTGYFENCKWLTKSGVTTAIGGHTNGWNPYVIALPITPGATINIKNCDLGGYNVFMQDSVGESDLNNILDFYNVINCIANDSTGWVEILQATSFN